jgi:hypothetical protein
VLVARGLVVGLPCVAVAFDVAEVVLAELFDDAGLLELRVVVVDAAPPSFTVGWTCGGGLGRVGLPLIGGAFPLPKDQPSKPPTTTLWLMAPRLLYVHDPPFDACQ